MSAAIGTPYRVIVFGTSTRTIGRGKRQRTETRGYAFHGWTPDQSAEPSRMPGSGTFCYAGAIRAIVAARAYLARPGINQVQIRTNQDHTVLVYNKQPDGSIVHYAAGE
jgi:hypothetical protein